MSTSPQFPDQPADNPPPSTPSPEASEGMPLPSISHFADGVVQNSAPYSAALDDVLPSPSNEQMGPNRASTARATDTGQLGAFNSPTLERATQFLSEYGDDLDALIVATQPRLDPSRWDPETVIKGEVVREAPALEPSGATSSQSSASVSPEKPDASEEQIDEMSAPSSQVVESENLTTEVDAEIVAALVELAKKVDDSPDEKAKTEATEDIFDTPVNDQEPIDFRAQEEAPPPRSENDPAEPTGLGAERPEADSSEAPNVELHRDYTDETDEILDLGTAERVEPEPTAEPIDIERASSAHALGVMSGLQREFEVDSQGNYPGEAPSGVTIADAVERMYEERKYTPGFRAPTAEQLTAALSLETTHTPEGTIGPAHDAIELLLERGVIKIDPRHPHLPPTFTAAVDWGQAPADGSEYDPTRANILDLTRSSQIRHAKAMAAGLHQGQYGKHAPPDYREVALEMLKKMESGEVPEGYGFPILGAYKQALYRPVDHQRVAEAWASLAVNGVLRRTESGTLQRGPIPPGLAEEIARGEDRATAWRQKCEEVLRVTTHNLADQGFTPGVEGTDTVFGFEEVAIALTAAYANGEVNPADPLHLEHTAANRLRVDLDTVREAYKLVNKALLVAAHPNSGPHPLYFHTDVSRDAAFPELDQRLPSLSTVRQDLEDRLLPARGIRPEELDWQVRAGYGLAAALRQHNALVWSGLPPHAARARVLNGLLTAHATGRLEDGVLPPIQAARVLGVGRRLYQHLLEDTRPALSTEHPLIKSEGDRHFLQVTPQDAADLSRQLRQEHSRPPTATGQAGAAMSAALNKGRAMLHPGRHHPKGASSLPHGQEPGGRRSIGRRRK
ncbi:MAG: hypothetical protein HOQ05_10465 [Corynebacteriales bacterium]|nr:hypothetical protein [Mycobacteriales bacterium]